MRELKDRFHVFRNTDVVQAMGEAFTVENSQAARGSPPEQKVLFKYRGLNVGELEMRNDSATHYQEVRFNMDKPRVMKLLFESIPNKEHYTDEIVVYGRAIRTFGNW
ncbi:MAG: hypothetical protein OXB89_01440 [Anaerolineaceae bacterium]|nr:hypothetical protein [Anaerolineaceae bacterium]